MFKGMQTPTPKSNQRVQSGMSTLTQSKSRSSNGADVFDDALSTHSSSCVVSTTSEKPALTRFELMEMMRHMSAFALHYANAYYGIGLSYYFLPVSARTSKWVTMGMQQKAADAFTTSPNHQRPDLVCLLNEVGYRLQEAQFLLSSSHWTLSSAEVQLRRCDMLLQEAELHLRFLQGAVGSMWFAIERDQNIYWEEDQAGINELRSDWAKILPQMCFPPGVLSRDEKRYESSGQRGRV